MIRTVVHFIDSTEFGGVERVLLHLVSSHDRERWRPVIFHAPSPGLAPLLDGARSAGVSLRAVPEMKRLRGIVRVPEFLRALQDVQPAVFHAHLNWPLACSAALLGAAPHVPVRVATVHLYSPLPSALTLGLQRRAVTRSVSRYLAVSQGVATQLHTELGVPTSRIRVIRNAVHVGDAPADGDGFRRALRLRPGRPLVLTLARLTAQKGLATLIEAARELPDADFVIAGEGPERDALEAQVTRSGLAGRVHLPGFAPDVAEMLAACDLFVLPSRYEGLPMSVLEAMAAGRAVVASAIPGIDEAVVHEETGLLVPPGHPGPLAAAMRELLADPRRRADMGAAGVQRVRDHFSLAAMARAIEDGYDELLAARSGPGS